MSWIDDTTTGVGTRPDRDLLAKIAVAGSSRGVVSAIPAVAGTGYALDDLLIYAHPSGVLDAKFVVTGVGGGGAVTAVRVESAGAFARRVSAGAVVAGGAGYADGDIIQLDTGTASQKAKFSVTTTAGAVTALTQIEGGGSYTVDPSAAGATTLVSAGAGAGCTVTPTMQAITGTSAIVTGGAGTGCSLTITLEAAALWTVLRDNHDYSFNGLDDEKEVVMSGTVSGGDEPIIAFRTFTDVDGITPRRGLILTSMDFFNPAQALSVQININALSLTPTTQGAFIPMLDDAHRFWIAVSGRRILPIVKAQGASVTSYHGNYLGLGEVLKSTTESPLPSYIVGSASSSRVAADAAGDDVGGLVEFARAVGREGPYWFRDPLTTTWTPVFNRQGTGPNNGDVFYPLGEPAQPGVNDDDLIVGDGGITFFNGIGRNNGAAQTLSMRPTPNAAGDIFPLRPVTHVRSNPPDVHARLEGVFWSSATKSDGTLVTSEDVVNQGGNYYRFFQDGSRTDPYTFYLVRMA